MKKGLCIVGFLILAAQLPLWGYDTSPSSWQVVPEVIWAAASGGGTWVTEVQITNFGPNPVSLRLYFDSTAGYDVEGIDIGPIPVNNSVKYVNILATMDALDSTAQVYYGLVGGLWLNDLSGANTFQVQAQTVNGNYGKTFPGLNIVVGNTLGTGRPMMVQGLVRNATYRTSIGVYNLSGSTSYTLRFTIYNATYGVVGASFDKEFNVLGFMAFNPFTQAGITTGDYDNCWLYVEVLTGGTDAQAPMVYGSIANNYTNDTYALMAKQYSTGSTAMPAPPIR